MQKPTVYTRRRGLVGFGAQSAPRLQALLLARRDEELLIYDKVIGSFRKTDFSYSHYVGRVGLIKLLRFGIVSKG